MDAEIIDDVIILELIAEPVLDVEVSESPIIVEIGEGGAAVWGGITGDIANQTDLQTALAGKSDTGHTHDDRYYTEAETDTLLSGKSDTGHTHDDRYYTEAETDTLLSGKSDTGHTHDDRYYTEAETDTLLSGKSATGHTHDDRYYTESEADDRFVNVTGDTMTGNLDIKNNDLDNTDQSRATVTEAGLFFRDKNSKATGYFSSAMLTSGVIVTTLYARRFNGSTQVNNYVQLKIKPDFTKAVEVSDPDAWRAALGLTDSGWLSLTNTNNFTGTIYYRKIWKTVYVSAETIYLKSDLSAASSRDIATIPSGYRPDKLAASDGVVTGTTSVQRAIGVVVDSSGGITLYTTLSSAITTAYKINFSISYPAA